MYLFIKERQIHVLKSISPLVGFLFSDFMERTMVSTVKLVKSGNPITRIALPLSVLWCCSLPVTAETTKRQGEAPEQTVFSYKSEKPAPKGKARFHVMLGEFKPSEDQLDFNTDNPDFDEEFRDEWLDGLPYFGGGAQIPFESDALSTGVFTAGWETGAYMSWKTESREIRGQSNGGTQVAVKVDTSFYGLDTFLGVYGAFQPIQLVRFYAGVGPMIQMGFAEVEEPDDDVTIQPISNSSNGSRITIDFDEIDFDADLGWYARAGVEFNITKELYIGVAARHINAELDLDESIGYIELEDTIGMITLGATL